MKKIILLLIVFVNLFSLVACNSTDTGSNIPTNKVELEELVEPMKKKYQVSGVHMV